jgi:hypothetical protein
MLLRRRRLPPLAAVERLIALQTQVPRDPYVALWSRLDRFRPEGLSKAIADRRAVRMTLLRATLHLVTARDALALRPLFQPVVERMFFGQRAFRRSAEGVDLDEVVELFRQRLEEQPRTRAELARAVTERWPDRDASSLGYAMYLLPTVQVTPRGLWRTPGRAAVTSLEHWLGGPLETAPSLQSLVTRYLAAFGPATPADLGSWSGLAGTAEVLEGLRPRLRVFRDDRGRELFDVPRAALPDPKTPAPVRFLPEFDNVALGHADRSRIVPEGVQQWTEVGWATVLVDGFIAARWKLERQKDLATLRVEPFRPLARKEKAEVADEGARLMSFLEPDAGRRDLRVEGLRKGARSPRFTR